MTQKQEIANLETELKAMRGAANGFKAEIERLQSTVDSFTDIGKLYSEIKAEAYKECIEKIKNELRNIAKIEWQDNYYYLVGAAFFDNILQEMVGENE